MTRLLVVLVTCLLAPYTSALNFSFLKNSVLARLTAEEMLEFRVVVSDSLANAADGKVVEWHSGSGKISAKILFRATYINDGTTTCRRVLFKIDEAGRAPERYRFDLCNNEEQWRFSQTSVSSFTTQDWLYLQEVTVDALDNGVDGTPVSWVSRKTGNSGVVTPLSSSEVSGTRCREVAFSIINNSDQTFDGRYTLCKTESGEWKLKGRLGNQE